MPDLETWLMIYDVKVEMLPAAESKIPDPARPDVKMGVIPEAELRDALDPDMRPAVHDGAHKWASPEAELRDAPDPKIGPAFHDEARNWASPGVGVSDLKLGVPFSLEAGATPEMVHYWSAGLNPEARVRWIPDVETMVHDSLTTGVGLR